jgi:glyoxalase family protein
LKIRRAGIELIATDKDQRKGFTYGQVEEDNAVKGFHSITLSEDGYEKTAGLLSTYMNHTKISESGSRFVIQQAENIGDIVDIVCEPERARDYRVREQFTT